MATRWLGGVYLLAVAQLIHQHVVVRLIWDRPLQSQAALCGVTLPNRRHKRWHCTDSSRIIDIDQNTDSLNSFLSLFLFFFFYFSAFVSHLHGWW